MKCTFISPGLSTDAIGIRVLSSLLKQQGHKTQLIFLPSLDDLKRRIDARQIQYPERILDRLGALVRDSDLIGISVMTHHYASAAALTRELKARTKAPVMWGGIHATVSPEQCLEAADLVGVGEAEHSLVELARRMDAQEGLDGVKGIWLKKDGRVVANGPGDMAEDLDALPWPDYSFEDHHLLIDGDLHPMAAENWVRHTLRHFPPFNKTVGPAYQVLSARGCPYRCSFCGEVPLVEPNMYGTRYFRRRSIDSLIGELSWVVTRFPFIGEVCFCDDTFPSRSPKEIAEFAHRYKEKIRRPFYMLASPGNVTKEKFDLLVDAGLRHMGMGIQSGSQRVLDLYERGKPNSVENILRAAKIINSYKCLTPYYDFIVENPYETREDILASVRLMTMLPRPMRTRVYALSFFPGTPLHAKAKADGILDEDLSDKTFGQRSKGGYLYFLIDLTKHGVPRPVLRLLISRPLLFLFNREAMDSFFLKLQTTVKRVLFRLHVTDTGLS